MGGPEQNHGGLMRVTWEEGQNVKNTDSTNAQRTQYPFSFFKGYWVLWGNLGPPPASTPAQVQGTYPLVSRSEIRHFSGFRGLGVWGLDAERLTQQDSMAGIGLNRPESQARSPLAEPRQEK